MSSNAFNLPLRGASTVRRVLDAIRARQHLSNSSRMSMRPSAPVGCTQRMLLRPSFVSSHPWTMCGLTSWRPRGSGTSWNRRFSTSFSCCILTTWRRVRGCGMCK
ncbi:hypothetical protein BCR44DRAFT_1439722 [Catenaria anguillulae PL171]|uniref:Uncharacterized protein n=1 Tax=Catenaria anguillulae PL171 TaxID=765915 RepID=A0A1Y2HFN1_9FUNG|nr:hypothetical protein BCR44DRAFT_1439722 [Catenaria anguillulae PL171]